MTNKISLLSIREAARLLAELGDEFALIPNSDHIHPRYEIVPLAPKRTSVTEPLVAVVMDMDGTTSTTEELGIYSLERMIRKMSGRMAATDWAGLDHALDYPHIIGNSTTKHVEYLITKYAAVIDADHVRRSYFTAALWTIIRGQDERRISDVNTTLKNLGCGAMLSDPDLHELKSSEKFSADTCDDIVDVFLGKYGAGFTAAHRTALVRAGIDIFYQIHHDILMEIRNGRGDELARQFLGAGERQLIEPMPGIGIALALMKGWLGSDAAGVVDALASGFELKTGRRLTPKVLSAARKRVTALGEYFAAHPMKLSVVTSSIHFEADIIMTEVCHVIRRQVDGWAIPDEKKKYLREKFSSYLNVYDGFVTASDSSEIRLKPHRDLYSMALHALDVPKEHFHRVAGYEDSESGTFALRTAGMGLCVAVPFEKSKGHNFEAASFILHGGMPEAIIVHNLFMPQSVE